MVCREWRSSGLGGNECYRDLSPIIATSLDFYREAMLQTKRWQQDWPIDARDRRFGEHGLAYMVGQQELKPNEYVSTGVVYAGAKQRCKMKVEGEIQNTWEVSLKDGETAIIVGLLADGALGNDGNVCVLGGTAILSQFSQRRRESGKAEFLQRGETSL
jgi:hypothetical protein